MAAVPFPWPVGRRGAGWALRWLNTRPRSSSGRSASRPEQGPARRESPSGGNVAVGLVTRVSRTPFRCSMYYVGGFLPVYMLLLNVRSFAQARSTHPAAASCPRVRRLCPVILSHHPSGRVLCREGVRWIKTLCKPSHGCWCLPPPLPEGVRFPTEQPWPEQQPQAAGGEAEAPAPSWLWGGEVCFVAGARASCRSGRGGREGKLKKKKSFKWQDWAYSMWPACAVQASGGSRSTRQRLWLGSSGEEKRRFRMEDSQTPASRRDLEVRGARVMVRCHPAANSAWSPGRANAWTVQDINYVFMSLGWFWLMMFWGRGRSLLSYVVAVWHYCVCGGGGILGDWRFFWGLLPQEDIQNFRFSGRIFGYGGICERTSLGAIQKQQRENRCKSTTSQKNAERKGKICNSQGSA